MFYMQNQIIGYYIGEKQSNNIFYLVKINN